MKKQVGTVFALTIFILIFVNSVHAEDTPNLETSNSYTIYVNNSGSDSNNGSSWQYAKKTIKNATGTVTSGGTVYIASGTYKGDNNRKITINKNLNIIGNGKDGTGNTTIDAEHNDYIFYINSGFNVTILNLTLQNGEAHDTVDGDDGDDGGAIYNKGNLTIDNCLFIANHARNGNDANAGTGKAGHGGNGGAIYNKGTLTVTNSNFENNNAGRGGDASDIHDGDYGGSGGAIYNTGTSSIINCSFKDNYAGRGGNANDAANSAPGGHGGAIFNNAALSIINCSFDGNYAGKGGDSSGLSDGNDGGNGGAIYNNGTISTIQNCTFTTNHAGDAGDTQKGSHYVGGNGGNGGAIYNYQKFKITIINCIFDSNYSGNGADGSDIGDAHNGGNGGTIYNSGIITISGGEIKNSYTGTGGDAHGAFNAGSGGFGGAIYNTGNLTISENCNIYNNTCGNGKNASTSGSTPGRGGSGGAIYSTGDLTISDSKIYGNNAGNSGEGCSNKNGAQGGDGGGIYNEGKLNLQNSLIYANSAGKGGDATETSTAGPGGNGGGIYNKNTLIITDSCQIFNNSAGQGGDGASGGNNPHGGEGGYGGAIYNEGNLNITGTSTNRVQIYNNTAGIGGTSPSFENTGGKGGKGGGIYNEKTCTVTYANIYNNTGGKGNTYTGDGDHGDINGGNGGDGGAFYNEGTLNLTESIITNNQAGSGHDGNRGGNGGNGGNGGAVTNTGTLNITNCQISNNKAGNAGNGGDYYYYSKWKSTYDGGEGGLGGSGGAIYNTGTLTITGSSIIQNTAGKGGNGGKGSAVDIKSSDGDEIEIENPGNGGDGGSGGGIYNSADGTINSITNSHIDNNAAGNGGDGGLYTDDIDLDLWYKVDPADAGNGGSGGGVYSEGLITLLQNTTINNNTAGTGGNGNPVSRYPAENGGNGGNGGGLALFNNIQISYCQISNNKAGNGGNGGNTDNGSDNDSTKPGNGGNAGNGGGIYAEYQNAQMFLDVAHCTIDNNTAGNGGNGGNPQQSGSGGTGGNGGGIFAIAKINSNSNLLSIFESTISNNKAGTSGTPFLSTSNGVGGGLYFNTMEGIAITFNRIVNNSPQAVYVNLSGTNVPVLYYNWWGSNQNPKNNITGVNAQLVDYSPWLILTINANPTSIKMNQTSNINANLNKDSDGNDASPDYGYTVPDGIPVLFGSNIGSVNPQNSFTTDGASSTVFNPDSSYGNATVYATVDYQTVSTQINIIDPADVRIAVYPGAGEFSWDVNNNIFWIAVIYNKGPSDVHNITSTFQMPAGFTFRSADTRLNGNYTYDSQTNTVTWFINSLSSDGIAVMDIFAYIKQSGNLTVTFSKINQSEYDPTTNNTKTCTVNVGTAADIQVTLNADKNNAAIGDTVTYTVTVRNNGPDTATSVKVNDLLPTGLTFQSKDTHGSGTYNETTGTWDIGTLKNGQIATLTLKATINTNNMITNTAKLEELDQFDWNFNNNNQNAILNKGTYNPSTDIRVSVYPGTGRYKWIKNSDITWVTDVYNFGPDDAHNVTAIFKMPAGFVFRSADTRSNGNYTYDPKTNTVTWFISFMPANGAASMDIFTYINQSGNLTVTFNKTGQAEYDPTPTNIANSTIRVISAADIQLKVINTPSNHEIGKKFMMTFKLSNNGPDTGENVVIKIPIPKGFEFISADVDQGTCNYDESNRTLIWNVGTVEVGDPYLYLNLKALQNGKFVINPLITSSTYDTNSSNSIIPFSMQINVSKTNQENKINSVKAASKTMTMQNTGLPLAGLILAILAVLGGLTTSRKK